MQSKPLCHWYVAECVEVMLRPNIPGVGSFD